MERNSISALHGQITVGTLILQVSLPDNSQNNSFSIIIFHTFFWFSYYSKTAFPFDPKYDSNPIPIGSMLHAASTFVKTLIYCFIYHQDCAVGLLFALLPVLGGTSGVLQGVLSMAKSYVFFSSTNFCETIHNTLLPLFTCYNKT